MPGTSIIRGKLEVQGVVHGALNCLITPDDNPDAWFFKQFPSQDALDDYVQQNNLIVTSRSE